MKASVAIAYAADPHSLRTTTRLREKRRSVPAVYWNMGSKIEWNLNCFR
jgi:hypothetical protein